MSRDVWFPGPSLHPPVPKVVLITRGAAPGEIVHPPAVNHIAASRPLCFAFSTDLELKTLHCSLLAPETLHRASLGTLMTDGRRLDLDPVSPLTSRPGSSWGYILFPPVLIMWVRLAQSFWHRPQEEVTWTFPPTE